MDKDYKPPNMDEVEIMKAVEEIKNKRRTSNFAMCLLGLCLCFIGVSFLIQTITGNEVTNSPLFIFITNIGSSCLTYLFLKNQDK